MSRLVVDASVAVKWLRAEEHSDRAVSLAHPEHVLLVPGHFRAEVANAMLSKHRRGEIDRDEARIAVRAVAALAITEFPIGPLLRPAMDIALQYDRTVYDALYVALAVREQCQLVTADRRLHNALDPAFPGALLWVGDLPMQ